MSSEQCADVDIRRRVGCLVEGDCSHFILSLPKLVQALICAVDLWGQAGWHGGESANMALRKPVWLRLLALLLAFGVALSKSFQSLSLSFHLYNMGVPMPTTSIRSFDASSPGKVDSGLPCRQ